MRKTSISSAAQDKAHFLLGQVAPQPVQIVPIAAAQMEVSADLAMLLPLRCPPGTVLISGME